MLADFFTKPLQGGLFKTFRNQIMNYNPVADSDQDYRSVLSLVESEPRTDDGWTKVERKTKRSKNTNGSPDSRKPYTNELQSKLVRFDDTETHKKMHIGDNGLSDPGTIMKRQADR
jgi:hypothetical protein